MNITTSYVQKIIQQKIYCILNKLSAQPSVNYWMLSQHSGAQQLDWHLWASNEEMLWGLDSKIKSSLGSCVGSPSQKINMLSFFKNVTAIAASHNMHGEDIWLQLFLITSCCDSSPQTSDIRFRTWSIGNTQNTHTQSKHSLHTTQTQFHEFSLDLHSMSCFF